MNSKRITAVVLAMFLAFVIMVTPILANPYYGNPQFKKVEASGPDGAGNMTVSFTVTGISKLQFIGVYTHGYIDAVYACKPAEGNFLSDPEQSEAPCRKLLAGGVKFR